MGLLRPSLPPGERFGALAEFATPEALYRACEAVRDVLVRGGSLEPGRG